MLHYRDNLLIIGAPQLPEGEWSRALEMCARVGMAYRFPATIQTDPPQ